MKALLVVCLGLYIGWGLAKKTPTPCPAAGITQIQTCYMGYFKNWNFTTVPPFETYMQAREQFFTTSGVGAFKIMCPWANVRQQCVGEYDPICANGVSWTTALGVSQTEAYEYLGKYGTDKWECGTGYNEVFTNFDCLENVRQNHRADILTCYNAYTSSIDRNCTALSTYVACQSGVYTKYCNAIGGYIGCELAKVGALDGVASCRLPTCKRPFKEVVGIRKYCCDESCCGTCCCCQNGWCCNQEKK